MPLLESYRVCVLLAHIKTHYLCAYFYFRAVGGPGGGGGGEAKG